MRRAALALLLLAAPAATAAGADPLQDQVLAGMKRSDTGDVAFSQTTRIERTGAAAQEFATRYDPRRPDGQRWSLVRVDGRAPTAKEIDQIVKAANGAPVPSYVRLAQWFGSPATRVAQTAGTVTFRFARLPAGVVRIGKHDASADTVADAVVNTAGRQPFVERVRFASAKPFRMMLVAKVDRYVFATDYALLADGRAFPAGTQADMAGSLMGKSGSFVTRIRYVDARPTR